MPELWNPAEIGLAAKSLASVHDEKMRTRTMVSYPNRIGLSSHSCWDDEVKWNGFGTLQLHGHRTVTSWSTVLRTLYLFHVLLYTAIAPS